jgi:hypothetical protein
MQPIAQDGLNANEVPNGSTSLRPVWSRRLRLPSFLFFPVLIYEGTRQFCFELPAKKTT